MNEFHVDLYPNTLWVVSFTWEPPAVPRKPRCSRAASTCSRRLPPAISTLSESEVPLEWCISLEHLLSKILPEIHIPGPSSKCSHRWAGYCIPPSEDKTTSACPLGLGTGDQAVFWPITFNTMVSPQHHTSLLVPTEHFGLKNVFRST